MATQGQFVQSRDTFKIEFHPQTNRLYKITLEKNVVDAFLEKVKENNITVERLEYTPYERHMVAGYLRDLVSPDFGYLLREIVNERATGGFTLGLEGVSEDTDDFVLFSTAISHLVGLSNHDAMSGKYYARFTVRDTDDSDSYLRQAYRLFTLHTDGTFVDEATDWLLMMKMVEQNAVGGESRLLHLDDWKDIDKYYRNPLATHRFRYSAPASKNVTEDVFRQTFFTLNNKPAICYIDQFVHPETVDEARYLKELSDSMEADSSVTELILPVGSLVVINNLFWLHGRAAFEKDENLNRELLRQRGRFVD